MDFDKSRVYTAVNADELKIGSKVIVGDSINALRNRVRNGTTQLTLSEIRNDNCEKRFRVKEYRETESLFGLAYLVSEPEEKKLKWTDLKIGDVIRRTYENGYRFATVIRIDTYTTERHIGLGGEWLSDDTLEDWEKVEE